MNQTIRVTTLVENSVHMPGLKAEHGLAFHLQVGDRSILFDTGQSDLILQNALRLGIALEKLDAIILSHGHYDHTSGLEAVLKIAPRAALYMHPSAVIPKYVRDKPVARASSPAGSPGVPPGGRVRSIGMPRSTFKTLGNDARRIITATGLTAIFGGVFSTGEIPRVSDFEPPEESFFKDEACTKPDIIPDDQALFFDSAEGLVVILGCAHSGVVNTLNHIRNLTGARPFHALLGGMHLLKADKKRIEATVEALRQFNFKLIAPAHCTGPLATAMIGSSFLTQFCSCSTGTVMTFQT